MAALVIPEAVVERFAATKGFSSSAYVLCSAAGTVVIDPGFRDDALFNYLETLGDMDAILLTHGHWVHLAGIDALVADYPDTSAYLPAPDRDLPTDRHLNQSTPPNGFSTVVQSDIQFLEDGPHSVPGYEVVMTGTTGTTAGSSICSVRKLGLLFTGDTFMADVATTTYRPTGSGEDLKMNAKKFLTIPFDNKTRILPDHGPETTHESLLRTNHSLQETGE
ncbi:MBL fold metallo-hydrolase [Arthrobacter psychrochitiniphilus]|uniref:MBL fold metallo-hydrolase n=1 Tax=Arthrobacter psychrochitiniphilus TaxID=291045 RepID=UPI003F7BFC29